MELSLSPVFYMQVGATSPKTMKILSRSKENSQQVVIGDNSGVITSFSVRKGDSNIVFKSLPGPKISRLELGVGGKKIYVAAVAEVKGFTKKGKPFLKFDTNLTEPIQSMHVDGRNLFVSAGLVYYHYVDCKDANYFLSPDWINDILCLPSSPSAPLTPVLACQDNTLRVLKDSDLLYEVEVAGPPLCVALNGQEGGEDAQEVLYGTQNGKIGLVKLTPTEPSYRWDMLNERKHGGITCLSTFDLTGDGLPDIIVGRDDGVVEVYGLDDSDEPRLKFTHVFNESVTSVDGGCVGSADYEEVVVATYSGRVMGLTREHIAQQPISKEVQSKLAALKEEVGSLEARISEAKDRYQKMVLSAKDGSKTMSALPLFQVNDKFVLSQDEAWYTLSIEVQVPIDTVLLQSDVPVDIQEIDKSSAVVSYTPPNVKDNNYLLATFRCHDTNRLEIKVRSIEGQYGTLQAYVTPRMEPKSCRLLQFPIKPLSLHRREHSLDETLPYNVLKMTGSFSLGEAHSWVRYCLPDVPEQPATEDTNTLYFKSTFIDTFLECTYKSGEVVFRSDNMSTISVLKEVLSKITAQRKMQVKFSHELNDASATHMLQLIYPRLESQLMLAKNCQLIEALQEVEIHEKDTTFLSPQCQFILENSEMMKEELKRQPSMIERLYALITDLYMDRATFKGQLVKDKVPMLLEILDNGDMDSLLAFFEES